MDRPLTEEEVKRMMDNDPDTISYAGALFYDVTSQVMIANESKDTRHEIEVMYHSFHDALEMDQDGKIIVTREKMLTLEYCQLFMMVMHAMNFFWRVRETEEDPGPEKVTYAFGVVIQVFKRHADHVRTYPKDASTWDEMEISLSSVRESVTNLLELISDYWLEDDDETASTQQDQKADSPKIVLNKDGTPFKMPPDEDETEDNASGDNLVAEFKEQEILQDIDMSRVDWVNERIMIVVRTTMNICVFITLVFILARLWAYIGSTEEKYALTDAEIGQVLMTIVVISILTNIKTIFRWFKELVHNG